MLKSTHSAISLRTLAGLFLSGISLLSSYAEAADDSVRKISQFISSASRRLNVPELEVEWERNREVGEIRGYEGEKRSAAVFLMINDIPKVEQILYAPLPKSEPLTVVVAFARIGLYHQFRTFLSMSTSDVVLRDFLDGEIADLTLVVRGRIPFHVYAQASENRESKRYMLLMQKEAFVREVLTIGIDQSSPSTTLPKKTALIALLVLCTQTSELCAKVMSE